MKRTYNHHLEQVEDAPDLSHLVKDKRSVKRATSAKGRRRNRRYENRMLNAQVESAWGEAAGESLLEVEAEIEPAEIEPKEMEAQAVEPTALQEEHN